MLHAVLLCLIFSLFPSVRPDCVLNTDDLDEPQPVVLTAYTHNFIYPTNVQDEDRTLTLPQGQAVLIACPGGHLNLDGSPTFVVGMCNVNDILIVREGPIDFTAIECDRVATSYRITEVNCGLNNTNNKFVHIGWDTTVSFVPLATVCFDFLNRAPVYTNFTIPKAVAIARTALLEQFIQNQVFYNLTLSIEQIYDEDYVSSVYAKLLGYEEDYFHNPYFREYLAKATEFYHDPQQKAIFRDILSWPQWRGCYPSDELASAVRRLVHDREIDVEIHTGALGISQLPHSKTQQPVDMYLYVEGDVKAVPVPVLIWRLVYEPTSRKAIVLAAIDNKNLLNAKQFVLCEENLAEKLTWVHWAGFSDCSITYACSYQDFKKNVPYLPNYNVSDVLI